MKWIWIVLALAGCGLHGRHKTERKTEAPAVSIAVAPGTVIAPGIVEPWDGETAIAPREIGWIAQILVVEGQHVDAGQTLAVLDDSAQQAAVSLARADVAEAEAALQKTLRGATAEERRAARAAATADDARASYARDNARRVGVLGDREAVPKAEVERASSDAAAQAALADESAAKLAAIERGARSEDRAIAQARVSSARARLEVAEAALARRRVVATIAGTVLLSRYHAGELFDASAPLFILGDLSRLRLRLEVDEIDAARVAVGSAAAIVTDDGAPLGRGTVVRIAPRMGRRTLGQENPTARADTRVREVFVELAAVAPATAAAGGPVPGMRLWGHVQPADSVSIR